MSFIRIRIADYILINNGNECIKRIKAKYSWSTSTNSSSSCNVCFNWMQYIISCTSNIWRISCISKWCIYIMWYTKSSENSWGSYQLYKKYFNLAAIFISFCKTKIISRFCRNNNFFMEINVCIWCRSYARQRRTLSE